MIDKNNFRKILLEDNEIPKFWYNVLADFKNPPAPYYNPQTKKLLSPSDMEPIFCKEIIEQEMSSERYIEIPKEVSDIYTGFRSTPLFRARRLEKALGTNAKIYYKYEGGNATGSHKLNTAMAQAYYNKQAGVKKLTTETGAGQWGSALSMACSQFDMGCEVFMVRVSYDQKPHRRTFMEVYGATVHPSPSKLTASGREILKHDPDSTGSLGMAISEAVEVAVQNGDTKYSLGSMLNHVLMHQTVIGLEAKKQLEKVDDYPDIVIGCAGGGSNFGGIALPFAGDKLTGKASPKLIAVEPTACPSLTKGVYAYDFGDTGMLSPICKMYTLGHEFVPSGIHAGGLRYHGMSPIISQLKHEGYIDAVSYGQNEVFEAGMLFANCEGIIPAPESNHAVKCAIDEAIKCREEGTEKSILFCLSGHGYFDMVAYEKFIKGKLNHVEFNDEDLKKSIGNLPLME